MKLVLVNGVVWFRYCVGSGGIGGVFVGNVIVFCELLLLLKL